MADLRDDDYKLEDDGNCCCGCSLECGITTFGVISIITFIISMVVFITACILGTAVATGAATTDDIAKSADDLA